MIRKNEISLKKSNGALVLATRANLSASVFARPEVLRADELLQNVNPNSVRVRQALLKNQESHSLHGQLSFCLSYLLT